MHSPCNTHDNFLRMLFDVFFGRPGSIWELDAIWAMDPSMRSLVQVQQSSVDQHTRANVVQVFVPKSKYPNRWSLRQVDACRRLKSTNALRNLQGEMQLEAIELRRQKAEVSSMLDEVRSQASQASALRPPTFSAK